MRAGSIASKFLTYQQTNDGWNEFPQLLELEPEMRRDQERKKFDNNNKLVRRVNSKIFLALFGKREGGYFNGEWVGETHGRAEFSSAPKNIRRTKARIRTHEKTNKRKSALTVGR